MSAEDSKKELPQQKQTDKMSTAAQKPAEELRPAIPVFSYAQAAKGKAPSVPATPSLNVALSDTTENGPKKDNTSEARTFPSELRQESAKRTASEGGKPQGDDFKTVDREPTQSAISNGTGKESEPGVQSHPTGPAPATTSISPSPDFGTTSVSTLPVQDDGFSAANGSSESTWDKQSQSSQTGSKNGEKATAEKESAQTAASESAWDEEKPALKEAPPPPVNFWIQRMAQTPKPKPQQSVSLQTPKPAALANGASNANEPAKAAETGIEPRKSEGKRKAKGNGEDRSSMKEGSKSADNKAKHGEGASKSAAGPMAPPPPPGDAISWPTPETAIEEEKKKPQERLEKGDKEKSQSSKPHGRKEWQHVPFVPTVNFNTPLPQPRRGGRPPGGSTRESGARGRNANGVDKATSTGASPINQTPVGADERGKTSIDSSKSTPQRPKRASSAGPITVKEQRKPGDPFGSEKRKDADLASIKAHQGKGTGTNESRRQSATAVNESQANKSLPGRGPVREGSNASKKPQHTDEFKESQDSVSVAQTPSRNSEFERRGEGSVRPQDSAKDMQANLPSRERGEGRSERGRGGYRGRGGANYNGYNGHLPNGHGFSGPPPQYQQPMSGPPSRSFSNHERLGSQPQGPPYPPTPQQNRPYRSNSRSQSIQHPYGRFSHGTHNGPPHLANLQTDLANTYGYPLEPQGSMSAMPYNPFIQAPNLFGMVQVQMEYYFSVDNLCKDTYLRSNMNSQGYVPLMLIAGFNRIKQLTQDPELVRYVCLNSHAIEVRVAEDGEAWLRRRDDWQQWVLAMEERIPSARNDGPAPATVVPFQMSQTYGAPQSFDDRQEMSPRSHASTAPLDSIQYQSLDGAAPPNSQVVSVPPQHQNGMYAANRTPLSAAVSEFAPSVRSTSSRIFSSPDPHAQGTSNISNEEMEKLHITYHAKPADGMAQVLPPFHSASSRTFSNGSIDATTINQDLSKFGDRQPRTTLNGDASESGEHFGITRSRSPFSIGSPGRSSAALSPPVLWFKDKEHVARMNSLPSEYTHAPYSTFRQSALSQRELLPNNPCIYDMQVLYCFWAHFLIRNFHAPSYEEFHRLAIEDESKWDSTYGIQSLMQYYDEALLGSRTIPSDSIARHFIEIVKKESPESERPTFRKLRAAWRNGAFSHKNRSKIIKSIDADLKAELDS